VGRALQVPQEPRRPLDQPSRRGRSRGPGPTRLASRDVTTDNAQEFRSQEFEQALARLKARHIFIRAGRPQSNGCVERVQETILEECWKPTFARYLIPKYTGLRLDLRRYLKLYNTDRAHNGRLTRGRTPEQVIGKQKMWSRPRRHVSP
jgi:transposase InsO family protein